MTSRSTRRSPQRPLPWGLQRPLGVASMASQDIASISFLSTAVAIYDDFLDHGLTATMISCRYMCAIHTRIRYVYIHTYIYIYMYVFVYVHKFSMSL